MGEKNQILIGKLMRMKKKFTMILLMTLSEKMAKSSKENKNLNLMKKKYLLVYTQVVQLL